MRQIGLQEVSHFPIFVLGVYQLPLFVVGPTLGLQAATAFGALMRVSQSARLVVSWIAMPFAYPIKRARGSEAAEHIRVAMTVSLLVGLMISIPLLAIPTELLTVWLGSKMAFAAPALAVVVVGVLAESLGQVPTLVMTLRGSPLVASLISLAVLVVTLPAVWLAARTDNLEIVMAASVVPLALAVPVQLHFSERAEPSGVVENLRIWALMVLAAGVGAVVFAVLGRVLPDVLSIAVCAVALGLVFRGVPPDPPPGPRAQRGPAGGRSGLRGQLFVELAVVLGGAADVELVPGQLPRPRRRSSWRCPGPSSSSRHTESAKDAGSDMGTTAHGSTASSRASPVSVVTTGEPFPQGLDARHGQGLVVAGEHRRRARSGSARARRTPSRAGSRRGRCPAVPALGRAPCSRDPRGDPRRPAGRGGGAAAPPRRPRRAWGGPWTARGGPGAAAADLPTAPGGLRGGHGAVVHDPDLLAREAVAELHCEVPRGR